MARILIGLLWTLHFLPLRLLAPLGQGFGMAVYLLGRDRRRVALTNLRLCFPELDEAARRRLARAHFRALGRSVLERSLSWWSSVQRLARIVHVEGKEQWQRAAGRPIILLVPHFVGFEMGGVGVNLEHPLVSIYSAQKDPVLDAAFLRARRRFMPTKLYSRQEGVRPIIRGLRSGLPFFYLPDMDYGARDAVFVPFFGVQTATITGLARIAQLAGAVVIPCITRQLPGSRGYHVRLYPPWQDFPSADPAADARRMNAFIEERVREMPEQYYWVHRRFKTRPPGEASPYED